MSAEIECPICMDAIESVTKNCVTTECGHCFHANCLMKSVAHNGFDCPYCRSKMAEVPEDDEDSFYDDEDEEEVIFSEYSLRGFRFFWNNINGEEVDEEDDADEQQLEEWEDVESEQDTDENTPTPQFVADKLRSQGITYEQLVHLLLYKDHDEYSDAQNYETVERLDGEVFGKIRVIVSNYEPTQVQVQQPIARPDDDSLPKNVTIRTNE